MAGVALVFFGDVLGLVDLTGLADFLAGFVEPATAGGLADECLGRAALSPLLTGALSSSAAFGMASAATLAEQNATATMALATLRVRVFIGRFRFIAGQNNQAGGAPHQRPTLSECSILFPALHFLEHFLCRAGLRASILRFSAWSLRGISQASA